MVYDVRKFPPSVVGTFRVFFNGSEITNICPAFDIDDGWADVFVLDQEHRFVLDVRYVDPMPMAVRLHGIVTTQGINSHDALDAESSEDNDQQQRPITETESSTEFLS